MYIHMKTYMHANIYTHMYEYVGVYVCMYLFIYLSLSIYIYIYFMYVCNYPSTFVQRYFYHRYIDMVAIRQLVLTLLLVRASGLSQPGAQDPAENASLWQQIVEAQIATINSSK